MSFNLLKYMYWSLQNYKFIQLINEKPKETKITNRDIYVLICYDGKARPVWKGDL